MIEIEKVCQFSSLGCFKQCFMTGYAIFMLLMSIYCMWNIYKFLHRFAYEHLPLATCMIQSLLHFIMFFFYQDNRLQIVTAYFCLQTYLFVAQSFVYLYCKLKFPVRDFKRFYRYIVSCSILYFLILTSLTIVCVQGISSHECDMYIQCLSLQLVSMLLSSIICLWSGSNLKKQVSEIASYQADSSADGFLEEAKSYQFMTLTAQITFVTYTLIISSLLFVVLMFLQIYAFHDVLCFQNQNFNEEIQLTLGQSLFLVCFDLVEMTPCILIPYVFYYLPQMPNQSESGSDYINFDHQQNDSYTPTSTTSYPEQEFSDVMRKRISEKITIDLD